jgi:PAS domain S-box-containing protein
MFLRPISLPLAIVEDVSDAARSGGLSDFPARRGGAFSMSQDPKTANSCLLNERNCRRHYFAALLVVFLGLILSAAWFAALRSDERVLARRQFEQSGRDHIFALQRTLDMHVLVMKSLRSLYLGSDEVTRERFGKFAAPLIGDHPGIRAVQWAPRTGSSLRDQRFPILFSEPRNAAIGTAGADLAANRACREAIRRACDLGESALTGGILLPTEPGNRREVRLFLPVYRNHVPLDTVERRREHLQGFIVGVFSPKRTLEESLRTRMPAGIDIWLVDCTDPAGERPLCYHESRLRPADADLLKDALCAAKGTLQLDETLELAGRRWKVICAAVPQFTAIGTTWHPWGAAGGGALLTALLAAYLVGMAKRDARMTQLAAQLTETNCRLEKESAERKQAESTLRTSQTKYRTLYELSSDAIMLLTPEDGFLSGNAATVALYGCKDEKEFVSHSPADLSPEYQPDGRPSSQKAQEMMAIALQEGTHIFQWKHKRADGAEFHSIVTLTRMELEGKRFLQATVHDISEQKRTQEALQAGERRLRLFAENVNDLVWTMDFSGQFTYMSPSMQRMLGFQWEEGAWLTIANIMTPASLGVFLKSLKVITTEAYTVQRVKTRTLELELLRQDGSTIWSELSIGGMCNEMGETVAIQGAAHDISERKQAEERQTRLLNRLEGVNRLQEDLLSPGDLDGKLKKVTQTAVDLLDLDFCRIWLVRPGDLCHIGCIHAAVSEGPDACLDRDKCLHLMASSGRYSLVTGEHRRVPFGCRKVGRIASNEENKFFTNDVATDPHIRDHQWAKDLGLVSFAGYKLRDGNGDSIGVFGMFAKHAISEEDNAFLAGLAEMTSRVILEHRADEELRETRKQAVAANQTKSRFLASISHEIRTPMTAILGYADLLMDPAINASSQNNYAAVIRRNGEQLLTLINDILDLSKIEAGKLALDIRRYSLTSLLADLAGAVRPRAEQRGLSLSLEYEGAVPETICTDYARLRQVLINLVGNAIKFTEKGGVRIAVSFVPLWCGEQPAVQIAVIDTGIGIREEALASLFQPFSQGETPDAEKFGPTGLGLMIARQIVHLLGGQLTVASQWGQGSAFTASVPTGSLDGVPMIEHPVEAEQSAAGHFPTPPKELMGMRVLLAEDGYDNREFVRDVLRRAGADVECVEDGQRAVAEALANSFDVILMDMNMPVLDGYEATQLLRSRGYTGPILALTANAMSDDSARCKEAGCNEHLSKPIDRVRLIRSLMAYARTVSAGATPRQRLTGGGAAPADGLAAAGEAMVSAFSNDPEMAMILGEFIGRLDAQIAAMRQAYADGRQEELQRLAHRLKGAGGSYGYPLLTDASKKLEEAVKTRAWGDASLTIDGIAAMCAAIQRGYAPNALTGSTVP